MELDEIMVDDTRERAKRRVEELKGFYSHLAVFLVINGILILINIVTSPGSWWFYWVTIFWGIGLAFHASSVFGGRRLFSREWEEKKIQQYIDEEKNGK
ncbi:MAG: hypothetical protein A4E42_02147 [Methanoregulaceae archaeon PtaU1.Bin222]|jgi:fatty acid desaturase|nr:MAG: hypothetical protein A4E42_02147 [Methanoregulaceae archaeon PtaU1.Bin222]